MYFTWFWKVVAVLLVAGLFYTAHALREAFDSAREPPWVSEAQGAPRGAGNALRWETIAREGNSTEYDVHTKRARVPGGWLVWHGEIRAGKSGAGMAFLPDPEHRWDGTSR